MTKQAEPPKPLVPLTPDRLWTVNEVAYYLSLSRWTVYKLVRAGELPSVMAGERLRFRPKDVMDYLK